MVDLAQTAGNAPGRHLALVVAGLAVLYAAPCLVQELALGYLGPWFSIVALGDLMGCLALLVLRDRRAGVMLYLALGVCKTLLVAYTSVPAHLLIWGTNAIPAVLACLRGQQIIARKMSEEPEPPEEY